MNTYKLGKEEMSTLTKSLCLRQKMLMAMGSKHLVEIYTNLDTVFTFFECCLAISPHLVSTTILRMYQHSFAAVRTPLTKPSQTPRFLPKVQPRHRILYLEPNVIDPIRQAASIKPLKDHTSP